METPDERYDVFISYSTHQRGWVEVLVRNLERNGVKPFFDQRDLIPGEFLQAGIARGIRSSDASIPVATPESLHSGWVQQEYQRLSARARDDEGFTLIPIAFGEVPSFDFLEDRLAVHFEPEPDAYRHAFHRVLCGLRREAPGIGPAADLDVEIPEDCRGLAVSRGFADQINDLVAANRALLLLAQADAVDGDAAHHLVAELRHTFDDHTVHDVTAPMGTDTDAGRYFRKLARRCGLERDVDSARDFEDGLEARLESGERILLLLRGFENGPDEARREVAGILRNLHYDHQRFRFVITGAARLAQLYFVNHAESPLRVARLMSWPEYAAEDIASFYRQLHGGELPPGEGETILAVSGGHLRLVRECFALTSRAGASDAADYVGALERGYELDRIVAPVSWSAERLADVRALAGRGDLGPTQDHLTDEALRSLYWWNLLTARDGRLRWRCPVIRDAVTRLCERLG